MSYSLPVVETVLKDPQEEEGFSGKLTATQPKWVFNVVGINWYQGRYRCWLLIIKVTDNSYLEPIYIGSKNENLRITSYQCGFTQVLYLRTKSAVFILYLSISMFLLLYTSIPQHLGGKYLTFYSITFDNSFYSLLCRFRSLIQNINQLFWTLMMFHYRLRLSYPAVYSSLQRLFLVTCNQSDISGTLTETTDGAYRQRQPILLAIGEKHGCQ